MADSDNLWREIPPEFLLKIPATTFGISTEAPPPNAAEVDACPVIAVRHAISCMNYAQLGAKIPEEELREMYANPGTPRKLQKKAELTNGAHWKQANPDFDTPFTRQLFLRITTHKDLVDAALHPYGIEQTIEQGKYLHDTKFHTVFVSPLRRTLQTCNYLFRNHPDRANIRFVVIPLLREWARYVDGVPMRYELLRKMYGTASENSDCSLNFDFSLMEKDPKTYLTALGEAEEGNPNPFRFPGDENLNYWGINTLANSEKRQILYSNMKNIDFGADREYFIQEPGWEATNAFLGTVRSVVPVPFENYYDLAKRIRMFKRFLGGYLKEHNLESGPQKVGIVGHFRVLDALFCPTSTATTDMTMKQGYTFQNCEIKGLPLKSVHMEE